MKKFLAILIFTCACTSSRAQVNIITTIAGNDTAAFCCDGSPAANAKLNAPEFICLDKFGNIYIADCGNNRVRKIDFATKIITTIAGNAIHSYNGDNIPATSAELVIPEAIATDTIGNVYIADFGNQRIRKITVSTGIITTVAGNGSSGSAGDGGQATDAQLYYPVGLCIDNSGNIYIGDYSNNKVRRVDAVTGIITTFAGKEGPPSYSGGFVGYSGDGGPATDAVLSGPIQVFADSTGNVYICDQWNHAIRKVDIATGIITTIAGTGTAGYTGDNGPATNAQLNQPCGMYIDKQNNIFIAEYGDGIIRRIDGITGIITTVAGTGVSGYSGDGGPATNAQLRCGDVAVDNYGIIYIADEDNNRIRMVYNPQLAIPQPFPKEQVNVYPNPAKEELNITGLLQNTNFRLFSIAGINMQQGILRQGNNTISMKDFASGIYILETTDADGQQNTVRVFKN